MREDFKSVLAIIGIIISVVGGIPGAIELYKLLRNRRNRKNIIRMPRIWISLLLVLCVGVPSLLWLWKRPTLNSYRYGFELGAMGWTYETYEDTQGVTAVAQSTDRARSGRYSLKMIADLEGRHPNRSKGEAFVEIVVQNLENKPITVWVYVPKEAIGEREKPSGIQVFAKDADWKGQYGAWWNITDGRVDAWHQVTLTPSRTAPPDGYIVPGFDPTQIRAIGVKVAIGNESAATFRGTMYIDDIDWP